MWVTLTFAVVVVVAVLLIMVVYCSLTMWQEQILHGFL